MGARRPRRPRRARRSRGRALRHDRRPAAPAWYAVASIAPVEQTRRRDVRREAAPSHAADAGSASLGSASTRRRRGRSTRSWHMLGSEHLAAPLRRRPAAADFGEDPPRRSGSRAPSSAPRRPRARDPPRRERRRSARTTARLLDFSRVERDLRAPARDRPAPDRRALVHAGGARAGPRRDGLRVPRHHLAAARLGALGRALRRARRATCVERFGIDEVARWGFEVWNEPNLEVFWTGTKDEYFRPLRHRRARGQGGGRAAAGSAGRRPPPPAGSPTSSTSSSPRRRPFDFFTTHTYGNLPLDVRGRSCPRGGRTESLVDGVGRDADALLARPTSPGARRTCSTG